MGKNKNTRKKSSRTKLAVLSIFILYFVLRGIPNLISLSTKTVFPEKEVIRDLYKTGAIIIRNEELYKSAGRGNVEYYVKEGERVPSGKSIAELKLSGKSSTYDQKLEELDKKIEILSEARAEIGEEETSPENTKKRIDETIGKIQARLQEGKYEEAEVLKEKLSIYENNKDDLENGKILIDKSLEELKKERSEISEEVNKNTIKYKAKDAGVVSFKVDGYEEVYKYSDRSKYKFRDLKEKPIKRNLLDNKVSENNEPIFKIISNYEWYMIVDATNIKDVDKYKKGSSIKILSKDEEISGIVENIQKDKESTTLLCKFNTNFEDFYDQRFIDIDVIRYKYNGFKIPKKAISEKDTQVGVFIRDISGVTRFRPVDILYEKNDMVYVSGGDEQNRIPVGPDDELSKTITRFDEIILNNVSMKEGIILK